MILQSSKYVHISLKDVMLLDEVKDVTWSIFNVDSDR